MGNRSASACIFCGAARGTVKMSAEHIIPRWSHAMIPTSHTFRTYATWDNQHRLTKPSVVVEGTPMTLRPRVVCVGCNSGWMSQLEDRQARPVLESMVAGAAVSLSSSQGEVIKRWAAMKSFVGEYLYEGLDVSTTAARKLVMDGYVPPYTHVWLGHHHEPTAHIWQQFYVRHRRSQPDVIRHAQLCVIVIGTLTIATLTSPVRLAPDGYIAKPTPYFVPLTSALTPTCQWPPEAATFESDWRGLADAIRSWVSPRPSARS